MMRYLIVLLLALTSSGGAWADVRVSSAGTTRDLEGAELKGIARVFAEGIAPPVTFVLDGDSANAWIENACDCDYLGDPGKWDTTTVADGAHVMTVNGEPYRFTVVNGQAPAAPTSPPAAPLPIYTTSWDATWKPVQGATSYRLEIGPSLNGPWATVWTGTTTRAQVGGPDTTACVRVFPVSTQGDGAPERACGTKIPTSPPAGEPREVCLVAGISGEARALYTQSSTGSRGSKVGELVVGPASGDFQRVECSCTDGFQHGDIRYRRLLDRDAYVSGCASTGHH